MRVASPTAVTVRAFSKKHWTARVLEMSRGVDRLDAGVGDDLTGGARTVRLTSVVFI